MSSTTSVEHSPHDPTLAAARLVESAVVLARAEAKLVLAHARTVIVRVVGLFLAAMLATSAAQVTLILLALAPAFLASSPRSFVLIAFLPSVCLSAFGAWLAVRAWRGLRMSPATVAE